MNRAIKVRIYPTTEQQVLFAKTFGCCRKVWNLMLGDKSASYEAAKSFGKQTPAQYKNRFPYLREVDSLALANVQMQLEKAIRDFCKNPKHFGFPHFKSKHRSKKSFTTNCLYPNGGSPSIRVTAKSIRLPKAGEVKAVVHRAPESGWKLKSVTVSLHPSGDYYASLLYEANRVVPASSGNRAIGLDYKSDGLYADSEGHVCGMPHYFRNQAKALAKQQRRLSRMVLGSRNYRKQRRKAAKIHQHIANQRTDFLHKESTEIANRYDVVCVEDLDMKTMANKGFGNGKATLGNGYGRFLLMLEYKLADRGKVLEKIDQWYPSSQICHACGRRHPEMKNLQIRTMRCSCGAVVDRDLNAARNILSEGLRQHTSIA